MSDLQGVQKDAPPLRYGVDDIIVAGRRRKRRRTAAWAAGTALAVVAAIAALVFAGRTAAERPDTPAVTSPAPSSGPDARHT
ncbi:hypothetical protein [Actinoplanes sp. GCM10030250]|uniref:hypothetical protein n=1 Tax=Actinoplanes sp. GCM10030250 TaxID=3273376 RepID=UPI00360907AF